MATNFRESLKNAMAANVNTYATARVMTLAEEPAVAAYSLDVAAEETWTRSEKYLWYEEYADENISTIDEDKNIVVHQKQINVTQESNSQFIPFRMPRRYDNVDLMEKTLLIHFTNSKGNEDNESPVNVSYSDNYIQFAWLVGDTATAIAGEVEFEIQAIGVNSKGGEYIWKTRPNGKLNIEKSLSGNGVIEPDSTWITSFMTQVTEKVAEAQLAANEAKAAAVEAQESANNVAGQIVDVVANAMEETLSSYYTKDETEQKSLELIGNALSDYYTKEEVDQIIAEQDFTEVLDEVQKKIDAIDGLANLVVEYDQTTNTMTFKNGEAEIVSHVLNTNPTEEWTASLMTSVQDKIDNAVNPVSQTVSGLQGNVSTLSKNLNDNYYTSSESDEKYALKSAVEDLNGELESKASSEEVGTLRTDVDNLTETVNSKATTEEVSALRTSLSTVETTANTNKSDLSTLSTKVGELDQQISELPTSAGKEYYATYDAEHVFKLYEVDGENESVKSQFTISGGGGGATTTTTVKIDRITASPLVVTKSDKAIIKYSFSSVDSSGDDTGEGTATWKVGSTVVATSMALQGDNSFDLTDYVTLGTQKITLSITDAAGTVSVKTWTIQVVDVRLESSFNDKLTYPIGTIAFDYTPYGAISKDIHFILDGEEIETITTGTSGIPMGYTIPAQEHGAHLFEVYMTAVINNNTIESNHIVKDILWYDENSDVPVIGCVQQSITALQYDTTNIVYTVYDPKTESPEVILAVDGDIVSTLTLDSNTQTWPFKTADIGDHVLTITCGETVKTINVKIEKLDIEIEPVTAGLVIDFNPVGKSNSDTDRVWHNDTYKMSVSENFDWVNGGYQIDAAGDQYFCIKAGTSVDIDYQMFADDAKRNGKEMKLIFRTTNVQETNAQFMSCVDNTTGTDHIGIEMFAHEAFIYGSADKLNLKYSEEDIIEFEFNITKNTEKVTEICGYEDGVPTRHLVYDDSFNFTQSTPKTITLGSDKCDLHIYRLKIYNTSLTDRGVLNNFIADARSADEMIDRHRRNQIYDENQQLTPEILAEKCPWLRVYVVSAPYFTNKKSDKVPYTTIRQIYKDGDPILDNWTCYDCSHSGQGTSSDNYGASARNLDFIMNKSQREGVEPYFILGDGKTRAEEVSLTRTSIPVAYYNFKANVASSNHFTNALLAKRYNEFNPYTLPYVREDESMIDYIKTTMEFHNAVVFIQETDTDLSTHREFADTDVHFYSIGNIGDSKKTDDTRLVDPADRYECINEICDVELPLSDWPNTPEAITALEAEKFDKSGSYEWRYIWEDGTDEENADVREYCKQRWIEMYKFVVQSTDEEFKAHFEDYFVLDSVLYYYLFTTRYCMVDNRSKNSFWHYGKTGAVDTDGNPVRKWDLTMAYDCDKHRMSQ